MELFQKHLYQLVRILLFIGIFVSAKYVSGVANHIMEFYKIVASQLSLLQSIRISQMEKDLEEKIKFVHRGSTMDESDEEPNL